ncbi:hypothetical protein [uncultured Clostridium sp.]|uniref:hypothetical protein n=1 Tax=uncultured Clostridium sp. TaxID=59620 RepID=UPI00321634D2
MKDYSVKQYEEQIILVTKYWGLSEEEKRDKYGRLTKIRRILIKMIKIPRITDESLYYWIYKITKKYIPDYRFENIFKNELLKIPNNEWNVSLYDIMFLMINELSTLSVNEELQLIKIEEILNL